MFGISKQELEDRLRGLSLIDKRDLDRLTAQIETFRHELKQHMAKLRRHIAASKQRNQDIRRRLHELERRAK